MPFYWDEVTGKRVLVDDLAAIKLMLDGGEDISEELPPPDHDYLCPGREFHDGECQCDLIAKVREDERINLGHDPRMERLAKALDDLCGQ